jgi:hypothetical protein
MKVCLFMRYQSYKAVFSVNYSLVYLEKDKRPKQSHHLYYLSLIYREEPIYSSQGKGRI